jgi:NAD(P)-dependent dehydrogenase (short-subunit alcohol dehydrogenase family)
MDQVETMDAFRLKGRVALVTGGARHLGYDMADALAEAGADLVITSRSPESVEAAADRLRRERGVHVLPLALDVRDPAQVTEVVTKAHDWKGRLDVLVNNAGGDSGSGPCHLFERSPEEMETLIATNLTGSLFCCQAAARLMARQGHGKILNIASIAGLVGRDRRMYDKNDMAGQPVDYAAAKAGVIGMTLDLAGLLGPMGIHVNAISPGGFARGQPGTFEQDYADEVPLGRMGRDDSVDLKGAVLFLASDASDYVTGQNLVVDGGFAIWK